MNKNVYLREINASLPRLLAMFDLDKTSVSYGMGDRQHWAWGLSDFANGTYQGAAHGLSRLWCSNLWPYDTPLSVFLARIDAIFMSTARITRSDGSLEEAFPYEGSYCVTALVSFDLVCTLDLLKQEIDGEMYRRWKEAIAPLVGYLVKADEKHAMISNHLATAVAALVRWSNIDKDSQAEKKAYELCQRILAHQSDEGWFKEYEGADPGYQTLCTHFLADTHQQRPDWELFAPLERSIRFLWHFAHPDGSFGGHYGSRSTRFYFPSGLEALSEEIPEANALIHFMRESISKHQVVTLSSMDDLNFVPMFNSYCMAAQMFELRSAQATELSPLPMASGEMRKTFPKSGLVIDTGEKHYTIINMHKGGSVMHFYDGKLMINDTGVVVRNDFGLLATNQLYSTENEILWHQDEVTIKSMICAMPKSLPSPAQYLVLRLLCVSLFRLSFFREWAKSFLVKFLITGKRSWDISNSRRIVLGPDVQITDTFDLPPHIERVMGTGPFLAIHMASQGYWQMQDEEHIP